MITGSTVNNTGNTLYSRTDKIIVYVYNCIYFYFLNNMSNLFNIAVELPENLHF